MPEPVHFANFTKTTLQYPGLFYFYQSYYTGINNKDYYKGKVIILIDESTQSQGEFTTMALRMAPNATVVGHPTSGADGDITEFYLPGNIYTYYTGLGVNNPDGSETQRVGIIPDIQVLPTIQGIKNGIDEPLKKAIELINQSTDIDSWSDNPINIYPNPAKDIITIDGLDGNYEFEIIDLYGKKAKLWTYQ